MTDSNQQHFALLAAWIIALFSTLAALFIGEVMGQMPCLLCWYQRIFMFPLAIILGLAVWRNDYGVWIYALPLAVLGWALAAFHVLRYLKIIPEPIIPCTESGPSCSGAGMLILGMPIPYLSLFAFTLIILFLCILWRRFSDE